MKAIHNISNTWIDVNNANMQNNCKIVNTIATCNNESATVMTDTVYNNSPKGRSMYQPGTQSYTPMIHAETGLVLSVKNYNKLCCKNEKVCSGQHDCEANFESQTPMDASEIKAAKANFEAISKNGLNVTSIICDGTKKVLQGCSNTSGQGPSKVDCMVHRSRAQRRKFYASSYSDQLVGKGQNCNQGYIKHMLAEAIVNRCTKELYHAAQKYPHNDRFSEQIEKARQNILSCFQGEHANCPKSSLVCRRKNRYKYFHLPYNRPITPTSEDISKLQAVIDHRLGRNQLGSQRQLKTTNKVESLHLRTLKLLPKTKTCKRHFNSRVHSAMHSQSVGLVSSLLQVNNALGVRNCDRQALKVFKQLSHRAKYLKKTKTDIKCQSGQEESSSERNKSETFFQIKCKPSFQ